MQEEEGVCGGSQGVKGRGGIGPHGGQASGCVVSKRQSQDFPGGLVVKNPPSNAGDRGLIPGWGAKNPCAEG